MDTGDDDLQSMLGLLLVRAEVANKETEDFQRAVKSLRSEARRHKAQADRYRSALGDLQRKHEQLQSETCSLTQTHTHTHKHTHTSTSAHSVYQPAREQC
jgi:septation ring formation regulator EzrA